MQFKSSQKTLGSISRLTIRGVFKSFVEIAHISGKSSMKQKEGLILKLLASSKGNETGYIVRFLQVTPSLLMSHVPHLTPKFH